MVRDQQGENRNETKNTHLEIPAELGFPPWIGFLFHILFAVAQERGKHLSKTRLGSRRVTSVDVNYFEVVAGISMKQLYR